MSELHIHQLRRSTVAALAALAVAAPPVAARPALEPAHHDRGSSGAAQAQTVQRTAADGGLEWGSVVIGAGAATAVCMLAGAGLTTASRRHHREPRTPSATAA